MLTPYYQDDWTTIFNADCREVMTGLSTVDHVITDPPYGEIVRSKNWLSYKMTLKKLPKMSTCHDGLGFDPMTPELRLATCEQALRLGARWLLIFSDLEGIQAWREAIEGAALDYVRAMVWDKVDSHPQFTGDRPAPSAEAVVCAHKPGRKRWNGGGRRSVLRYPVNGLRGHKPHPSTKPEPLMCELIRLFTDPGELILDPFMGSGSTLAAAKRMARRSIGIEIQEKYCEVAVERLRQESLLGLIETIQQQQREMKLNEHSTS